MRKTTQSNRPPMSSPFVAWAALFALVLALVWVGCGQQNEYLAEGKDILKTNRRNRIARAVEKFQQALADNLTNREKAETHYLLGYYTEELTPEQRAGHFVQAARLRPKEYEDALIHEALRDRDDQIRESVRLALARLYEGSKPTAKRIPDQLVKALEGKDGRSRNDAAWVLGYLAADDPGAIVPLIKKALDHKRMETRLNAVIAVEELAKRDKSKAREFIPLLRAKIEARQQPAWWRFWNRREKRESPEVRILAISAFGTMDAVDELIAILKNKGSFLRSNAMQTLIASGASDQAIQELLFILQEEDTADKPWHSSANAGRRMIQIR